MRRLLLLLLLPASLAPACAEHIVGAAAAPSGARCRLFVLATAADTRFVLAERGAEQDAVTLLDDFAPPAPALGATALEDAYAALRPAFRHAQELLLARPRPLQLEPRHCHAHVLATGAAQATHLHALFARVHQESIEDAQFPFLLAKDDLRRVDAETQSYFLAVGANFLDGRVPPSLSPGSEELHGVLALDADAPRMTFDVLERWRRAKRQKHLPLNTTDFFIREYAGHSRAAVRDAVAKQLRAAQAPGDDDDDALRHPCFLPGYEGEQLRGTGDAHACVREIQAYVDAGNAKCPADNFCALNGAAQPRPTGPFYGAGLFRSATAYAHAALQSLQTTDAAVASLALPAPTLAALRAAAVRVCAVPFAQALALPKVYARQSEHACLDLCHAVVLLRAFGVRDDEARVQFASPAAAAASAQQLSADEATWLTGAFEYLEAIQQRKAFVMEAELLAVQVDEGLPIGFHLSLALFVAAAAFLVATTGGRSPPPLAGSRRRPSVVVGAAKPPRSTHAILFVDDSSE